MSLQSKCRDGPLRSESGLPGPTLSVENNPRLFSGTYKRMEDEARLEEVFEEPNPPR